MAVQSPQGVELVGVDRQVPDLLTSSAASSTVDVFDPLHHHLVWSQRAGVEVRTRRLSMLVVSPSGLWIPSGHPYTIEASAPWWSARFAAASCPPWWGRVTNVTLDEVIAPMLIHLRHHARHSWSPELLAAVVAHLEEVFLHNPAPLRLPIDPRGREVADGILADPGSSRDVREWAEIAGTSERTLRRLFAEQTGMSLRTWRAKARIHAATRLLTSGRPATEVARRCGYGSTIAFTRAFAAETGLNPSAYLERRDDSEFVDGTEAQTWPTTSPSWPVGSAHVGKALHDLLDNPSGDDMAGRNRIRMLAMASALLFAAACGDDDDAATASATAEPATTETTVTEPPTTTIVEDEPATTTTEAAPESDETEEVATTRVLTDMAGREVEIPTQPQRVMAMHWLRLAAPLTSLGYQPYGVAGTDEWREAVELIADPGVDLDAIEFVGSHAEPNLELLASAEPDLILALPWQADDFLDQLEQIAPTVVIDTETVDDPLEGERLMADIVGVSDSLEARLTEYENRVEAVRSDNEGLDGLTFNFLSYNPDSIAVLDLADTASMFPFAVVSEDLGLQPAPYLAEVDFGEANVAITSVEQAPSLDADIVVVGLRPGAELSDEFRTLMAPTSSVQNDQFFEVDNIRWTFPGLARWFLVLDDFEALLDGRELVDGPN